MRLRTRVGKSLGLRAFQTKPSDLLEKANEYRQHAECGRYDLIASTIKTDATMVTAQGSSFDPKWYMSWAPALYNRHSNTNKAVWSPDYWMLHEVSYEHQSMLNYLKMEQVYEEVCKKHKQQDMYVPIRWTTSQLSESEIKNYLYYLICISGRKTVPLYYYAIRREKNRMILYAKTSWLETFKTGQDLVNIYRMSVNLKKVYGFS